MSASGDRDEVESIPSRCRFGPLCYGVAIALAFWSTSESLAACLSWRFFSLFSRRSR